MKKKRFVQHPPATFRFFFLSLLLHTVILFKCQARKAAWRLIAMLCSGTARQLELISAFLRFCEKEKKKNILLSFILLRSPSSTTSRTSPECHGTAGSTPWPSSSATTRPRRSPATQVPLMSSLRPLPQLNTKPPSIHPSIHPANHFQFLPELRVTAVCWSPSQQSLSEGRVTL